MKWVGKADAVAPAGERSPAVPGAAGLSAGGER